MKENDLGKRIHFLFKQQCSGFVYKLEHIRRSKYYNHSIDNLIHLILKVQIVSK